MKIDSLSQWKLCEAVWVSFSRDEFNVTLGHDHSRLFHHMIYNLLIRNYLYQHLRNLIQNSLIRTLKFSLAIKITFMNRRNDIWFSDIGRAFLFQ